MLKTEKSLHYQISRLDNFISILRDREIYVPSLKQLNDPFEALLILEGELSDKNESSGVLSFTTSVKNNLMWSHYSISHMGAAIKFSVDMNEAEKNGLRKVYYIHETSELKFLKEPLVIKSHEWAYENEYRYIFNESKFKIGLKNLGLTIEGVYLGANIDNTLKRQLIEHLDCLDIKYSVSSLGFDLSCSFDNPLTPRDRLRSEIFHTDIEPSPAQPDYDDAAYIEYLEADAQIDQAQCDDWENEIDENDKFKKYLEDKKSLKAKLGYTD